MPSVCEIMFMMPNTTAFCTAQRYIKKTWLCIQFPLQKTNFKKLPKYICIRKLKPYFRDMVTSSLWMNTTISIYGSIYKHRRQISKWKQVSLKK